ncbi:MAG: aminopeptidase P N-terminal domain-containing protein, partial [Gemmatimonadales bacterium]
RGLAVAALVGLGVGSPVVGQVGSPAGPVPAERLAARRAVLFDRMKVSVAVLRAGTERSIEGDYPQDNNYREDNDFFYLTGLEVPRAWLVLIARDTAPDETILLLPPRDSSREKFTGPGLSPGPEVSRLTGITDVRVSRDPDQDISAVVFPPGSPARAGALYIKRGARQGESLFLRQLVFSGGTLGPPVRVEDLDAQMAALRLVKDPDEIGRMRRAIGLTADGIRQAMKVAEPGIWEYQLEGEVEFVFRRGGGERLAFPSIIGSGPNGTTLHYDKNRRQTQPGELVVMDVGAEWGYQTADVTRTIPVSGKFTQRQRDLYNLVLATQQAAIDSVRPGLDLARLNQIARDYMRAHSGSLCGGSSCDQYWIHGLSHWVGMDVHDVGPFGTRFEPGMVFSVEPGIYLPQENLGIRIEDDVLVTPTGHENLSAGAPRTVEEIERAMR